VSTTGPDARALGGAWLPLHANFAPDRALFFQGCGQAVGTAKLLQIGSGQFADLSVRLGQRRGLRHIFPPLRHWLCES
jgi:hypothetical protein